MFKSVNITSEDLTERIVSKILNQFKQSPIYIQLLEAFALEIQAFLDAATDMIKMQSPYHAGTYALDIIGRIVGQRRTLIDAGAYSYFKFDESGFDSVPWWISSAPLSGSYPAGDEQFRKLIEGKIYRNHVKYGSIPEIKEFVLRSFGITIDVEWVDLMTVRLWVPNSIDDNTITLLGSYTENGNPNDRSYFIPLPAGYEISEILKYHEPVIFDYDSAFLDGSSAVW